MPKQNNTDVSNLNFLIDECLTPALITIARDRGHQASHVSRLRELKGKSDKTVTFYALQKGMIVVTNNLVDFEEIYQKQARHPGLIFLSASGNLINRSTHILMFEAALEELEKEYSTNEAIHLHLEEDKNKNYQLTIERYILP